MPRLRIALPLTLLLLLSIVWACQSRTPREVEKIKANSRRLAASASPQEIKFNCPGEPLSGLFRVYRSKGDIRVVDYNAAYAHGGRQWRFFLTKGEVTGAVLITDSWKFDAKTSSAKTEATITRLREEYHQFAKGKIDRSFFRETQAHSRKKEKVREKIGAVPFRNMTSPDAAGIKNKITMLLKQYKAGRITGKWCGLEN